MKIIYWECDRCKKKLYNFNEIETHGLIKKSFELCLKCTDELKKWLKFAKTTKWNIN